MSAKARVTLGGVFIGESCYPSDQGSEVGLWGPNLGPKPVVIGRSWRLQNDSLNCDD